ncbi:hypothetical protein [Mycobacterium sp. NAZ190054]|uniref:hypothetical protein n=1 Tax=Mycobacterium sp. NAZ190054 TaxID=1747766 RepID=UPI00079901D5|nr:hypothetical protein [Mycobacterium sp. NAZ190054]KWX66831.1 hypothetical protein ASJ79_05555 [Mycobacterium sp. NAZ190054]
MTTAAERAFNDFIRRWVAPAMQPHLLDADDNAGEKVRRLIRELAEQQESRHQVSDPKTCEICGRVGTRRYVPIGDAKSGRWRCSPTATACIGNQPTPADCNKDGRNSTPNVASASDIPAKQIPPKVTPAPEPPAPRIPHSKSTEVTARCVDCTRTYTLTGRVLQQAIDMHELKHGHIVQVVDQEVAS